MSHQDKNDEIFKKQEEAKATIRKQIGDLARFNESLGDKIRPGFALEGLERWKNRTVKLLIEKVSAKEAKKLNERCNIHGVSVDKTRYIKVFNEYLDFLNALLQEITEHPEDVLYDEETIEGQDMSTSGTLSKKVFVIHGHDTANRELLGRLLRDRLKLEPIVIVDTPGMGRTLWQMLDDEGKKASFAIALLTPDDIIQVEGNQYPQARPNVIFELGWFYGRLGPQKTCIILKTGTNIPSDLAGVKRIEFSTSVEESFLEIHRELRAAGLLGG